MAKQTFTTGQVLTAAQMTSLQQTAMGGGSATAKTASATLVAADAGTTVIMNSASATTITVNTNLFSAGDTVFIQNIGAGVSTITAGSATVNTASSLALAQYESGRLYFTAAGASIFSKADGAAASGGGMTSLASGSLAAAAVGFDLTSIDQTYNALVLYVAALSVNVAGLGSNNIITLNNDAGDNYSFTGTRDGAVVNRNSVGGIEVMSCEQATGTFSIFAQFNNYANATSKKLYTTLGNSHATVIPKSVNGMWADNSAINRITLTVPVGAYDAGTYILYGVK